MVVLSLRKYEPKKNILRTDKFSEDYYSKHYKNIIKDYIYYSQKRLIV